MTTLSPPIDTADSFNAMPQVNAVLTRDAFAVYRDGLLHDWVRILAALGIVLIPLFLVLDYFTMPPQLQSRFVWYRAFATLFALGQFVWIRRTLPTELSLLHGYAFTLVVGGMITRMTVDLGGFDSGYYAGLNLVLVAVNLLLPWRAAHSALNGLMLIGMYVFANTVWGGPFSTQLLINNLYFLSATMVIAVAINFTKHRLIEQEFRLRQRLVDTNVVLDQSREELKVARDALWGEMEVAKHIQTALLPKNRSLGGYQAAAVMVPAEEVGGDYYDLIETRAGESWVAIGDVSGHGVESGLVMMMAQTTLLTFVNEQRGRTPSEVFRAVNATVRENVQRMGANRYMTLNIVRLFPDKLLLAGKHQDILVHRAKENRVESLTNEGCWVGMVPDTHGFTPDFEIPLAPGDSALFFTDGVTEGANEAGEMYGEQKLAEAFGRTAHLPPEEVIAALLAETRRYQARQDDDLTMVLLRRS